MRGQPVVVADDPGYERRVADRDPPRPRQHRRLDAGGHRCLRRGHVVGEPPAARQRRVPEDRVADEPVFALGGQQRLELTARPRGVEVAPADRGEARVPVPLPRVVAGARAGVGERHAVGGAHTLAPVLGEGLVADCRILAVSPSASMPPQILAAEDRPLVVAVCDVSEDVRGRRRKPAAQCHRLRVHGDSSRGNRDARAPRSRSSRSSWGICRLTRCWSGSWRAGSATPT